MAPSAYNKLQNKHVLILGGSSGIGYAVADGSLASGAKVTISSSSQTKVDAAVSRLKSDYPSQTDTIVGFPADLCNPTTVEDDLDVLFKKAESTHGTIHHVGGGRPHNISHAPRPSHRPW